MCFNAFDKAADLDVLDHPILNLLYYLGILSYMQIPRTKRYSLNEGCTSDRVSSFYNGSSNRYSSPVRFSPGRVGSGSMLNSTGWKLWDNESLNYGANSANSTDFVGSRSGDAGYGTLGVLGTIWGSSSSGQGGGNSSFGSGNIANSGEAVGAGYGQNSGNNAINTSPYALAEDTHAGAFGSLYGTVGASFYKDSAWLSTSPELDDSAAFGYGLGNTESLSYVGGYSVANRSNKGIVA